MITLAYDGDTLPLDVDLYWIDEFKYSPVAQQVDDGLTGALIIQVDGDADRPGRPITLQPEDDFSAWMIREDLETLNAWGKVPGAEMVLTLRGVARPVMFRHQEPPAIDAKPVVHYNDAIPTDFYLVTLKFMEV